MTDTPKVREELARQFAAFAKTQNLVVVEFGFLTLMVADFVLAHEHEAELRGFEKCFRWLIRQNSAAGGWEAAFNRCNAELARRAKGPP